MLSELLSDPAFIRPVLIAVAVAGALGFSKLVWEGFVSILKRRLSERDPTNSRKHR